jgi:xylulokinase
VYLGIDVGTSAVKAILLDDEGAVRAQASAPLSVDRPQPLWSEQDPDSWWRATVDAVRALPSAERQAVEAVGLSGQMHGATLLDARDRPLRPAILWNDGRSDAQCRELERREPRSREITGNLAMPGFTAPKLLWVRAHEPEVFARIATVLLPKDYVRLRLTGDKGTDLSDAAGTLWLDVAQRRWSEAMLAASELSVDHMPALFEGTAATGRLTASAASELGVPRVIVAAGAGDNAASAAGLGVVRAGEAFLSLGTSGVLFVVTDRFRPNPKRAVHAFCHCLPATWHQMSVMLSAASALDWVSAVCGYAHVLDAVEDARQRGLMASTPLFLPYLAGERTPHNNPRASGVFFGLRADTQRADLVAGALLGLSLACAEGFDALLESGGTIGEISLCGGGSRLDYWMILLASALQRPLLRRSDSELGAALGAARLARAAGTGRADAAHFPAPALIRRFEPDPRLAERVQAARPRFGRLYTHLASDFEDH